MTNAMFDDKDAYSGKGFELLHHLLFALLLKSDGRTTDMLETLMDDTMRVRVIAQEQIDAVLAGQPEALSGAPYYIRESVLISPRSGFVVSHNIALVCSQHVPQPLFEALSAKREGIGKTIGTLGLQTSRKLVDCGWRSEAETVDLFQRKFKPEFASTDEKTPFKQYAIYFESAPGIHMIEYFNPAMIRHRLNEWIPKAES